MNGGGLVIFCLAPLNDFVNRNDYQGKVTHKELRRFLQSKGCAFRPASGHDKVYLGNRMTVVPRHGTDIGPFLLNKILRGPRHRKGEEVDMLLYPVRIVKDGEGFTLTFPDVAHAHTNGATREDALAHAPDALRAAISMLMEKNLDIPAPGKSSGPRVGLPSVIASAKAELYMALRASGMRKAELARRMGIHKQQVERLLDIDHASRMDQIEAAFAALNKRLVVDVRSAA